MQNYAIGQNTAADDYFPEQKRYQGWYENHSIEISVWTTDSADRDNLVELIKIWMLELEQGFLGEAPFYWIHGIQAVRYTGSSEEERHEVIYNGAMHIGRLNYTIEATFFNRVEPDEAINYRIHLEARVRDCIRLDLDVELDP